MKILKYIFITSLFLSFYSCSEDILIETPLEFYGPDNSYTTSVDIEAAVTHCYADVRTANRGDYADYAYVHIGTDLARYARNTREHLGQYAVDMTPDSYQAYTFWRRYYKLISNANVILDRIETIEYSNEDEKTVHIAEAKFFRAWSYRCLVHLYGGVPLVEHEIKEAKRDFVRATKEETYDFIIKDLLDAAAGLPDVEAVSLPGKASSAAAYHLLSEIYLAAGKPADAIAAATKVIDNPNIELMTTRFGVKADQDGDPYWDLHQMDNQNRSSGNKEGIFVIQMDLNTVGGGAEADWHYNYSDALSFERGYGPLYWYTQTPDGYRISQEATSSQGGRPVGLVSPTQHVMYDIWYEGGNWDKDQRNNERNIRRDWLVENQDSEWFGKYVSEFPQEWHDKQGVDDTTWYHAPYITKVTTMNDHPDFLVINEELGWLSGNTGITYHDWYLMRVAETYLLRAEGHLLAGDKVAAAADINKVRLRSGATPVASGDVTLDYILDERLRELNYEEPRRMTLSRMGKLVERTKKYNLVSGASILPQHELFPIPNREIELNTEVELTQNDGYVN